MTNGSKKYIQILLLHREFNNEIVEKVLIEAASKGTLPTYVIKTGKLDKHIPSINVTPPNVPHFDQLLQKEV